MTPHSQAVVDLGKLAFILSRVKRVTYHDDGVTRETDSDHTVMLSLVACAYAEQFYKDILDIGKVAQFAIIHDLIEAYAGDTDSLGITNEMKQDKLIREEKSLTQIHKEFDSTFPWLTTTLEEYNTQVSKEARFIKLLDKAMPKITNILNNGKRLLERGETKEQTEKLFADQIMFYTKTYGDDFPEVLDLMNQLMTETIKKTYA